MAFFPFLTTFWFLIENIGEFIKLLIIDTFEIISMNYIKARFNFRNVLTVIGLLTCTNIYQTTEFLI